MKRKNIIPFVPVGRIMEHYGAERVSHDAKITLADYLEQYAAELGRLAYKYAKHAGRETVVDKDLQLAVRNLPRN